VEKDEKKYIWKMKGKLNLPKKITDENNRQTVYLQMVKSHRPMQAEQP